MTTTLLYFSGTGNTRWAAEQMQIALTGLGQQCNIYSIEQPPENLTDVIKNSDQLGIAFPVYAMNIPPIMNDFIQKLGHMLLGRQSPIPLFVLITAGYVDGCGPYEVAKKLPLQTVKLRGYAGLKIANNVRTPTDKSDPLAPGELSARIAKAKDKIAALAQSLASGKKSIAPGMYSIVVFRHKMSRFPREAYKMLSINKESCTRCLLCVNNCPTKSIIEKEGSFEILPTCTACMRCYNFCPTASVLHGGQYANPAIYTRYKGPVL